MASRSLLLLLVASICSSFARAELVTFNWNLTWVKANPDGLSERKVIGINNTWPLPVVEVNKGDQVVFNIYNGLGDKHASTHFHGMYQNATNEMDGASYFTQCPIFPGSMMTYNFTVNQNGTYWYHCHTDFCYPDGYRQAFIVHDPDAWWNDEVEEEFTVTLSDWYHEMTEYIGYEEFMTVYNPTGAEPIPDAFLFNDTLNTKISVEPNTTYVMRIINTGAFTAQYFYIEDHDFEIIEVDGVYTEPTTASLIYLGIAQRYAIKFTTKASTDKNYGIVTICDSVLLDTIPDTLQLNLTNWLSYNEDAAYDKIDPDLDITDSNPAFDDFTLVPYDHTPLFENPSKVVTLELTMGILENGIPYAFLNDMTYTRPIVPTIFSAMSSGGNASDALVYGTNTNAFVLDHNDVVEVVINNNDGGTHPFHLHGHNFQVIERYPSYGADFYEYSNDAEGLVFNSSNATYPTYPIRRDTMVLPPMGYMVLRFVADNPGIWVFHCHIDWHLMQGLAAVFVEAPLLMQERLNIPENHYEVCKAAGVASVGNAAGNTEDYLDLSGQRVQAAYVEYGAFTTKGYVAMAGCVVSAICGMIALTIYGLTDSKVVEDELKRQQAGSSTGSVGMEGEGEGVQTTTILMDGEK